MRRATVAALLTVVMVPHASTTSQATTKASPTPTPILSDEEQGCVDAFMTHPEDIEDVMDGFDLAAATLPEYQDVLVTLVPAGQALVDRVKGMRCDVFDGTPSEELAPIIVDIARTEAPGSVTYLELSEVRTPPRRQRWRRRHARNRALLLRRTARFG